ncbi:MAG: BLUF domain-containing protein [Pseudomonadota bacterium]
MGLRQLLYMSELARPFESSLLEDIKAASGRNNERWQVSGCLLYSKGHFLQLLEGPEESVERLFGIISADGRHARVRVLHDVPIKERLFDGWEMRTYNLESRSDLPQEFIDRVLDWIERHESNPLFLFRILDDFRNYL